MARRKQISWKRTTGAIIAFLGVVITNAGPISSAILTVPKSYIDALPWWIGVCVSSVGAILAFIGIVQINLRAKKNEQ